MANSVVARDHESQTHAVVAAFSAAWLAPQLERFVVLLHHDVVLLQPVTPPIRGRGPAREEFARLLAWLPDIQGAIDRTAIDGDTALIAWRLRFTLGGRPYEMPIVDRLVVADGLIRERQAYYDSLHLVLSLLARPSGWLGYLRYRGWIGG